MTEPTNPESDDVGGHIGDDERGSEVSDYTSEIPRADRNPADTEPEGPQPSGFGDGDVADVETAHVEADTDDTDDADTGTDEADADDVIGQADDEPGEVDPAADDVDHSGRSDDAPGIADEVLSPEEIAVLTAERDQYRDAAIRLQADFENFRKRSNAQSAADIDRATGRMAEALLPVLDAAETAYVNHPDEVGPLFNALLGELRKQGLETVDLAGTSFDPEVAEAVAHEPGDGGEVVVDEVLRSGYRWKGKTLRPAMVKTTD